AEVLDKIETNGTTELLAIVGNMRGAQKAALFSKISWLGYPFSVSETFLRRNLNSTIPKAFGQACELLNLCARQKKKLMVYLSMGFGNPYNDPWSIDLLAEWVDKLRREGATEINLSDTIGISTAETVGEAFWFLLREFPDIRFGFHLHSKPDDWYTRIDAAWRNGCRSFDGVLLGGGGCPMTGVALVGNLAMQHLVSYFEERDVPLKINSDEYQKATVDAGRLFHEIESNFKSE
ncbi:MAG: hydroxymethylglutaryl-CoA lyase, partial [Bacteroidetes bacterium HGW-Bacteroidetes-22]